MILEGKAWGELEVFTAHGQPRLSENDAGFLRAIADQLVGAIHRAELFAQVEELAYTDSLTGVASRRAVELALEEACADSSRPGLARAHPVRHRRPEAGERPGRARGRRPRAVRAPPRRSSTRRGGTRTRWSAASAATSSACCCRRRRSRTHARSRPTPCRACATAGGERISCGVAARTDGESPADLLRAADEAQYRAKRAGDYVDVVAAGDPDHRAARAAWPRPRLPRERLGGRARARSARHARRDERRVGRGAAGAAARSPGAGELSTPDWQSAAIRRTVSAA